MRFYPTTDVFFCYEIKPLWDQYCHVPNKSWKERPVEPLHHMYIYRDLEGAAMKEVLQKDYYFEGAFKNPTTRVRLEACLPSYYGVGSRFIRLEKGPPLGFKCAHMPTSFKEVVEINAYYKRIAKEEARMLKLQRRAEREANQSKKKKRNNKIKETSNVATIF